MMEDLPVGWQFAKLGEITSKVGSGATPRGGSETYQRAGIPLIRSQNVRFEGFTAEGLAFLNRKQAEALKEVTVQSGDVLLNITGASIGRVTQAPSDMDGARVNQHVCIIRPKDGLSAIFLARFLASTSVQEMIWTEQYGVTRQALTKGQILDFNIPVPPTEEQQRIATVLEELLGRADTCKQRLSKIPVIIKRFRQSVLAAACSGRLTADWRDENQSDFRVDSILASVERKQSLSAKTVVQKERLREVFSTQEDGNSEELPNNWQFIRLNKLVRSFDYGTSTKSKQSGKVPVLRMGNLQKGSIDWSDLAYTSDAAEIRQYSLSPQTVLFNRTNSPELVGKTAIYRGERPAIFAGYLIRINPYPELNPEYLNLCLSTTYAREFCASVKTDGVSQSNINAQKLGAFEVPFCHPAEQIEIVRRVESLFSLADRIEARFKTIQRQVDRLPQSILAKAFRGELVPTEAERAKRDGRSYESAEQLLARIRTKKATTVSRAQDRTKKKRVAMT